MVIQSKSRALSHQNQFYVRPAYTYLGVTNTDQAPRILTLFSKSDERTAILIESGDAEENFYHRPACCLVSANRKLDYRAGLIATKVSKSFVVKNLATIADSPWEQIALGSIMINGLIKFASAWKITRVVIHISVCEYEILNFLKAHRFIPLRLGEWAENRYCIGDNDLIQMTRHTNLKA